MPRTYLVPKVGAGTGADPFHGKFGHSFPGGHRVLDFPSIGLMLARTVDPPTFLTADERAGHDALLEQLDAFMATQPDCVRVDDEADLDRDKAVKVLAGAGIDKEWLTGKLTAADVRTILEADATTRQVAESVTVMQTQLAEQQAKLAAQQKTLSDLKRAVTADTIVTDAGKKPK